MLDFIGIGAQKAGTTWLYEKLRLHPGISLPAGKEVHFWDQRYSQGIEWYKSLFGANGHHGALAGEITPAYAILSKDKIRECREHFPDLKLIYIIRNPIERAWSSAKMALVRAELEMDEVSDQWFIDHFRSRGSTMRGDYEECLRNWLAAYSETQMLICLHDELKSNPRELLLKCFKHIGVDERRFDWSCDLRAKVFSTAEHPLPDHLKKELERIYRPKIESLANHLGLDLRNWL